MKKIAIITSSRADWGLLKPVVEKLDNPVLIITGSHLSEDHGMTKNEIYGDLLNSGIPILPITHEVEILLSSDTEKGVCSAAGMTLIKFGELFDRVKPDLVLVLGDRFEVLSACMAAHIHRIPIAHIHGGDISGNFDNAFRHSITHMADIHFPATEKAKNNIMRMRGFRPVFAPEMFNVHMVGALGVDGLKKRTTQPKDRIIVAWHPETSTEKEFESDLLGVIYKRYPETLKIHITPNADNGRYAIAKEKYHRTFSRDEYIKLLSESWAIVGNSSSGIIESAALGVPTVNVGQRQAGRECAASIIDCKADIYGLLDAFDKLESKTFQDLMKTDYYMPYKGENVAGKIVEILNNL